MNDHIAKARALLESHFEEILNVLIQYAKAGDREAIALCKEKGINYEDVSKSPNPFVKRLLSKG